MRTISSSLRMGAHAPQSPAGLRHLVGRRAETRVVDLRLHRCDFGKERNVTALMSQVVFSFPITYFELFETARNLIIRFATFVTQYRIWQITS